MKSSTAKMLLVFVCLLGMSIVKGGENDIGLQKLTNSFKNKYKDKNPSLKYSYDDSLQIHDYSNNWDFDGDRINDSLYFIGNGGAHLFYYPKIVLSSNKKEVKLPQLEIDFPYLSSSEELVKKGNDIEFFPKFAVGDFDQDGRNEIYLNVDLSGVSTKDVRMLGLKSNHIVIDFSNGKMSIKNYSIK